MGRSQTIHVLGYAPDGGELRIYRAMNKTEIAQARKLAERDGLKIKFWQAQTKTGAKMIGAAEPWTHIDDEFVKAGKAVTCPVCEGIGQKDTGEKTLTGLPIVKHCIVCNGSGICKPGHEKRWQEWQLNNIRKDFGLPEKEF